MTRTNSLKTVPCDIKPPHLAALLALLLAGSCREPDPATVDLPDNLCIAFEENFSQDDETLMPPDPV